jgi:sugar phosphate isomerase/epimerase
MKHDYSLAHLTALNSPPPQLVEIAAGAGYRYVGLRLNQVATTDPVYPLVADKGLMQETKARLADTGVEVLDIELARLAPEDEPEDFLPILEAGAELGARHVIAQLPDPERGRKIERFAALCDLARPLRLTVELEFPSWTQTPSLAEAAHVLRAANRSNAGMLVDLLHFSRSRSSLEELKKLPREWFRFVHVCDAPREIPASVEGLIRTARLERLFPGEGELDVHGILGALPGGIPYALEIPRVTLATLIGEKEYARLALRAARAHLDEREQLAEAPH